MANCFPKKDSIKSYKDFIDDDSLISTPKPQATSTVNHRKNNDCYLDEESIDSGCGDRRIASKENNGSDKDGVIASGYGGGGDDTSKFLLNERDLVDSLKKELDKVIADVHRGRKSTAKQSVETNSSLGIIRLDSVQDIGDLNDTTELLERLGPQNENDCEASWRLMKELARQTISSRRNSSLSATKSFNTSGAVALPDMKSLLSGVGSCFKNLDVIQNGGCLEEIKSVPDSISKTSSLREPSQRRINPFDGEKYSILSLSNEEFTSGENAAVRLLQDEAAWIREKAVLPVENEDKSLSGIFPDDDRLSSASSYLRKGSGPLGNLNGSLDSDSRPNFGTKIFSPIKRSSSKEKDVSRSSSSDNKLLKHLGKARVINDNSLDNIPTKDLPTNSNNTTDLRKTSAVSNSDHNKKMMLARSSTSTSNTTNVANDDRLSVSSVASITHIAELLGDMSMNSSPRVIIDRMLSAGASKDRNSAIGNDGVSSNQNNRSMIFNGSNNFIKKRTIQLNSIKEDIYSPICEQGKLEAGRNKKVNLKEVEVIQDNADDSVNIISDDDNGKENLNESVWIIPSRMALMRDDVNDKTNDSDNIFKIPDNKKFIKRRKHLATNRENKTDVRNITVLSDATNTTRNSVTVGNDETTKKLYPSIIDVETNKTIFENLDNSATTVNKMDSEKNTRYSSSNLSSVNDILYSGDPERNNNDDDIYEFDIMHMNELPLYSSNGDLNSVRKHYADRSVIRIDDTNNTVNNDVDRNEDDKSVICLSSNADISLAHYNVATSINTSLDGSTNCNIVKVCVGSLVRCTIPVDSLPVTADNVDCNIIRGRLSISNITCEKMSILEEDISNKIVRLFFPEEFLLKPDDFNKDIEVLVVPLVAKSIEISLQLKMTAVQQDGSSHENLKGSLSSTSSPLSSDGNVVNCVLTIIGEHPQLTVVPKSLTETSFNGINFGLLPEESLKKSFIKIQNNGDARVPVHLEISQLSSEILIFYMTDIETDDSDKKETEVLKKLVVIDPGDTVEEPIYCFTPSLSVNGNQKENGRKIGQVSGQLSVSVACTESDVILPKLAQLQLLALVGRTRVLIAAHCNPLLIPASHVNTLLVRNAGVTPVVLKLNCDNPSFSVIGEQYLLLEPDENGTISIQFKPNKTVNDNLETNSWKGTLWLSVASSEIRYSVTLQGQLQKQPHQLSPANLNRPDSAASSSSSGGSNGTAPLSRSSSPSSNYSRSSSGDGGLLELACTCSALVWASCPLLQNNATSKKSCVLRNKRNCREKLLLTVSDPFSSYKIVEEKGGLVSEMRLNLEAMESRQITISFNPTQVGPCKGSLIITRVQRKSITDLPMPLQKKVLHLYGYGGRSVLNIKGVFRDPELRMWTYLDSNTLQSTFTLENIGDGTAFVKLGQEIAATGVKISPEECLIAAHKSVNVELTFFPTAGRADHLLSEKNSSEVLNVTRVTITHGDEATRLRLKRLYCRLVNEKQQVDSLLMERLAALNNLFPGTSVNEVSTLKDKMEGIKTLWLEGIRESNVGVLLERTALENAQLDSTAQFIDLATTIMDETICTSKLQQLIVAPRVVNLSQSQPVSSFSLRNTTVLQSRFHIEVPKASFGELVVEPRHGMLPPHTSCLLTVKCILYVDDYSSDNYIDNSSSCTVLKIHSDLMNVIEVPLNWNRIIKPTPIKPVGSVTAVDVNRKKVDSCSVYSNDYDIVFPTTMVGRKSMCRVCLRNVSDNTVMVTMNEITGPFEMRTLEFPLKGNWYLNFKVYFKPLTASNHNGVLKLSIDKSKTLTYFLRGNAILG